MQVTAFQFLHLFILKVYLLCLVIIQTTEKKTFISLHCYVFTFFEKVISSVLVDILILSFSQWKATRSVIQVLAVMAYLVLYFVYNYKLKIIHEIITDVTQHRLPLSNTKFSGSQAIYLAFPVLESRMIVDYSLVVSCC